MVKRNVNLKDITFENKRYICPRCKIPLELIGYKITKDFNLINEFIWFLFHPDSWLISYGYKCDKCKHIYEVKK